MAFTQHTVAAYLRSDNSTDVLAIAVGKVDGSEWPLTLDMPVRYWDAVARGSHPPAGWQHPEFDDSGWSVAPGGWFCADPGPPAYPTWYRPPKTDKYLTKSPSQTLPMGTSGDFGSFPFTTLLDPSYMTVFNTGTQPGDNAIRNHLYVRTNFATDEDGDYRIRLLWDNRVDFYLDNALLHSSASIGYQGIVQTLEANLGLLRVRVAEGVYRTVGCDHENILADDFNRLDGTSEVLERSDGGLWTVGEGTPTIAGNKLTTAGGAAAVNAVLEPHTEMDGLQTTIRFTCTNPFQRCEITWGDSFQLTFGQYEAYFHLRCHTHITGLATASFGPGFEDALEHTLVIDHDYTANQIRIYLDGVQRLAYNTYAHGHGPTGDDFQLRLAGSGWKINDVQVQAVNLRGQLRLEVEPGVWVREVCGDEHGLSTAHPLRVRVAPGVYRRACCMLPEVDSAYASRVTGAPAVALVAQPSTRARVTAAPTVALVGQLSTAARVTGAPAAVLVGQESTTARVTAAPVAVLIGN